MRETSISAFRLPRPVVAALGGIVVLLVAAAGVMWLHYGTAVFYEMIVAGIAACL